MAFIKRNAIRRGTAKTGDVDLSSLSAESGTVFRTVFLASWNGATGAEVHVPVGKEGDVFLWIAAAEHYFIEYDAAHVSINAIYERPLVAGALGDAHFVATPAVDVEVTPADDAHPNLIQIGFAANS